MHSAVPRDTRVKKTCMNLPSRSSQSSKRGWQAGIASRYEQWIIGTSHPPCQIPLGLISHLLSPTFTLRASHNCTLIAAWYISHFLGWGLSEAGVWGASRIHWPLTQWNLEKHESLHPMGHWHWKPWACASLFVPLGRQFWSRVYMAYYGLNCVLKKLLKS